MKLVCTAVLVHLPLLLVACQRYSPAPLDLAKHRSLMERRTPSSARVAAYAKEIAATTPHANNYDPDDGLTLDEAEVVTLFLNPQLRLARLRANVSRVGAAEAGRWEDPELQVDGERIIESVDEPWVLGAGLAFTIPLSGRLRVERQQAWSQATLEKLRALAEERRVLGELRTEWIEWSAVNERARLAGEVVGELSGLAERADRLRQAGELDPLDARLLRLEAVTQTSRLRGHEASARTAELRLKARLGLAPSAAVKLVPSLAVRAVQLPSDEDIDRLLADHPRLQVARAEYEVAEKTLQLEVKKQYPDLTLGGGFGTDEGTERVLFGASLPLPIFNANRRAIAEAAANREAMRAAAEAQYEQLIGDVAVARATIEGAAARLKYVESELAPLADQQVQDALRRGKVGDFNAIVLLEALTTAHEAKVEVLDARVAAGVSEQRLGALIDTGSAVPATTMTSPSVQKDNP